MIIKSSNQKLCGTDSTERQDENQKYGQMFAAFDDATFHWDVFVLCCPMLVVAWKVSRNGLSLAAIVGTDSEYDVIDPD